MAGPLANLLLAIAFAAAARVMPQVAAGGLMRALMVAGVAWNCALALFNLFPIPPLDGFSMLLFFVPARHAVKIFQFRQKFGFFSLLLIFGISNMFWAFFWPVYSVLRDIAAPL